MASAEALEDREPRHSGTRARFSAPIDVHLMLLADDKVLLGRRAGTGWCDGDFHLPAGHLEAGESVVAAAIREADEELGILIDERDVKLGHLMHNASGRGRLALFFTVRRWHGEVTNREPDKCSELRWCPTTELPDRMVDYARTAIDHHLHSRPLSLYGW